MTVSAELKALAWAAEGRLPLVGLEIAHSDLAATIRVVDNNEDAVLDGVTYTAFPFDLTLPSSLDDAPPRARLRVDNVSREIGQAVRSISTPATVTIRVARVEEPVTHPPTAVVEAEFPALRLLNVTVTAASVEGELALEDLIREPFPAHTFSPAQFPGLVR